MNLIVNPLAAIEVDKNGVDFISGGPVPGQPMKFLNVSSATLPRIHTLFRELSVVGLANLDVEADVHADDVGILRDHGILVEPNQVPQRPLFACLLDDVEETGPAMASLIVNPTLEFRPFDLTKFRYLMQEKHLSPHFATAWATDPATGLRWGYWLSKDQAEIVQSLEPGSSGIPTIDPATASRLWGACILIDPDAERNLTSFAIGDAANSFQRERYAVLNDLVPPAHLRALQAYYRGYVEQGFMRMGDRQVERRFAAYGEPVATMLHEATVPLMSRLAGLEVVPTYCYSVVYVDEARLDPHVDRGQCEFSFSFQLEYLPATEDEVSPWPLYLSANDPGDLNVDPARDNAIHLANGSFLAYKGRELVHYRTPLPTGHRSSSIFFHYGPA